MFTPEPGFPLGDIPAPTRPDAPTPSRSAPAARN